MGLAHFGMLQKILVGFVTNYGRPLGETHTREQESGGKSKNTHHSAQESVAVLEMMMHNFLTNY